MRSIILTALFICLCICMAFARHRHKDRFSVVFGNERKRAKKMQDNTIRIFLDKNGYYYPDLFINDHSLKKDSSSLRWWYSHHIDELQLLCGIYKVNAPHDASVKERIMLLNNAVADSITRQINYYADSYDLIDVSIHGFRKKMYKNHGLFTRSSRLDSKRLEKAVRKEAQGKKILFIEVYWDAKFMGLLHAMEGSIGYKLFADSVQSNALKVGLGLRKTISNIHKDTINVITHSLGARVACELLFNASQGALPEEKAIPAPPQYLRVCLVAPAIGSGIFKQYYYRDSRHTTGMPENYSLSIVYNVNDIVLNKNYPLLGINIGNHTAIDFAETTLGCNYDNDIWKLQKMLTSAIDTFDLSTKKERPRKCHYLNNCYIQNKEPFSHVVKHLNE